MDDISLLLGLGEEATRLTTLQVALRAVIVFFATLVIVRIANKRFFAKKTAFDVILGFMLASMMARAINGSEQLVPTIVAGFLLAFLHRLLARLACTWPRLGGWIKGYSQILVTDGKVEQRTLTEHHLGEDDLLEDLRLKGVGRIEEVRCATLERSGEVSVVRRADQ